MTKTATLATRSPLEYATGVEVLYEDARDVGEMLNWAAGQVPATHLALAGGPEGWGAGPAAPALSLSFSSSSGWQTRLKFRVVLHDDVQSIVVGVRCTMTAGQTGVVRVTAGGAPAALVGTYTTATNGSEQSVTIATSSCGVGMIEIHIEANHTVGSGAGYIRTVRVEEATIAAAALPDPPDA